MVKKRTVISKDQFDKDGRDIAKYIRDDSEKNANKFIQEVDKMLDNIKMNPKGFPPEPNLPTKRNLYRFALVMKSWKIVYKVSNKLLVFLGIIHSARHPKEIKKLRTNNYD